MIGSSWICRSHGAYCPFVPNGLRLGGWLAGYSPSIIQASQLVDSLREARRYVQIETNEVLLRGWHIHGQAVRPEHEMVGHTGFITVARLVTRDS